MKLLDTSVLVGLLRGEEKVRELVKYEDETMCTCFPVEFELYRGTKLARKTEEGEIEVESLLDELKHLQADKKSAKKVAELRESYPELKTFDLMIAGICLANNTEIITKDEDFEKIDELESHII